MSKTKKAPTTLALTRRRSAARRAAERRKTAGGRLSTDGRCSVTNIRRRLRWLAHEYQITESELPKITPSPTEELCDFIQKYRISYDGLIAGNLKGLQRMTSERKVRRVMTSTAAMNDQEPSPFHVGMTGDKFAAALRTLPQAAQREIEAKLRQVVEDQKQ